MNQYQPIALTEFPSKRDTDYFSNPNRLEQEYELEEQIGQGGYGFVIAGTQRSTGRPVAIKFIYKDKIPRYNGELPSEVSILKQIRHPSVVEYIDHFEDHRYYYLVMELFGQEWSGHSCPSTSSSDDNSPITPSDSCEFNFDTKKKRNSCDLFECIETFSRLSEHQTKTIFQQVINCVKELHDLGIYHRDIKDENIVIDSNFKVKLIDFGSAIKVDNNNATIKKFHGTVSFASPEILLGLDYKPEPAEVWSLGVLLYTLLCGRVPFASSKDVISGLIQCPPSDCSESCLDLILSMLRNNPKRRFTIEQILQHEWLN